MHCMFTVMLSPRLNIINMVSAEPNVPNLSTLSSPAFLGPFRLCPWFWSSATLTDIPQQTPYRFIKQVHIRFTRIFIRMWDKIYWYIRMHHTSLFLARFVTFFSRSPSFKSSIAWADCLTFSTFYCRIPRRYSSRCFTTISCLGVWYQSPRSSTINIKLKKSSPDSYTNCIETFQKHF